MKFPFKNALLTHITTIYTETFIYCETKQSLKKRQSSEVRTQALSLYCVWCIRPGLGKEQPSQKFGAFLHLVCEISRWDVNSHTFLTRKLKCRGVMPNSPEWETQDQIPDLYPQLFMSSHVLFPQNGLRNLHFLSNHLQHVSSYL